MSNKVSGLKHAADTVAQTTIPVPISVSGVLFLGVSIKDWVLMGTALLIIFQLIVIFPKAVYVVKQLGRCFRKKKEHPGEDITEDESNE